MFRRRPATGITRCLIALACLLALASPSAAQQINEPHIALQVEGRVAAEPDLAILRLGVETRERDAQSTVSTLTERLTEVMAALAAADLDDTDIQTSALRLQPVYRSYDGSRQPQEPDGYLARSEVTIRVRDVRETGRILDAAVRAGANIFNELRFAVAEPGPLLDEARRRAMAEATRRAELYADAAGVALGPLLSLTEQGGARPMMMRAELATEAAAVPVAPGEVSYSVTLSVTYALQ